MAGIYNYYISTEAGADVTTDQAINAIRAMQLNALRAAGNVGLTQVLPSCRLIRATCASGTVKDDGKDVYIVFGGKDSPG